MTTLDLIEKYGIEIRLSGLIGLRFEARMPTRRYGTDKLPAPTAHASTVRGAVRDVLRKWEALIAAEPCEFRKKAMEKPFFGE